MSYIKEDSLLQDIIGKGITKVIDYNIRNRKFENTNPFYITKSKKFLLGILTVSASGNNNKEQLVFVANILKLPPNSNLIQFKFWNSNN